MSYKISFTMKTFVSLYHNLILAGFVDLLTIIFNALVHRHKRGKSETCYHATLRLRSLVTINDHFHYFEEFLVMGIGWMPLNSVTKIGNDEGIRKRVTNLFVETLNDDGLKRYISILVTKSTYWQ